MHCNIIIYYLYGFVDVLQMLRISV